MAIPKPDLGIEDISNMALAIVAPQLTASTISTFMIGRLTHAGVWDDILTVLDFSLTTFPLTLAVAIIVSMIIDKSITFWNVIMVIIVAGIAANLLSKIIPSIHHTDNMTGYFLNATKDIKGPMIFVDFAARLITVWWRDFGPIMFIQALIVGSIFGYKLTTKKTVVNVSSTKKPSPPKPPPPPPPPPPKDSPL